MDNIAKFLLQFLHVTFFFKQSMNKQYEAAKQLLDKERAEFKKQRSLLTEENKQLKTEYVHKPQSMSFTALIMVYQIEFNKRIWSCRATPISGRSRISRFDLRKEAQL